MCEGSSPAASQLRASLTRSLAKARRVARRGSGKGRGSGRRIGQAPLVESSPPLNSPPPPAQLTRSLAHPLTFPQRPEQTGAFRVLNKRRRLGEGTRLPMWPSKEPPARSLACPLACPLSRLLAAFIRRANFNVAQWCAQRSRDRGEKESRGTSTAHEEFLSRQDHLIGHLLQAQKSPLAHCCSSCQALSIRADLTRSRAHAPNLNNASYPTSRLIRAQQ